MSTPILALRNMLYEHRDQSSHKMKEVDRWLFGINQLQFHLLSQLGKLKSWGLYEKAVRDWSDNTALRLNEKTAAEAVEVFEKYCPPNLDKAQVNLGKINTLLTGVDASQLEAAKELAAQDAAFYQQIAQSYGQGLAAYRQLLPLWCIKAATPLYSMKLWEDTDSVVAMGDALYEEFLAAGYHHEVCERFTELVFTCASSYAAKYAAATPEEQALAKKLAAMPVEELHKLKHEAGYKAFPAWLEYKEQLIWNFVACALYGPQNARPQYVTHTELASSGPGLLQADPRLCQGSGQAILCRIYESGATDMVSAIQLGRAGDTPLEDSLVMVLGREYQGPPDMGGYSGPAHVTKLCSGEDHTHHYATLLDSDSARHLGVYIVDGQVVLTDLGSTNGSFVRRGSGAGEHYLVMLGRNAGLAEAFEQRGWSYEVVDTVVAMRGDRIFLGASQFELL